MGRGTSIFWGGLAWLAGRRRLVVLVIILVVAATVLWQRRAPEPPVVELEGVDPVVAAAVTEARQAVSQEPRSPTSWGHLGMLLAAHNFRREARACLAQAERLDPADTRWPYLQGALLLTEDPEAAVAKLRRAAEISTAPTPRLRLAETLLEQGRLDEADGYYRQALEEDPEAPRAHLGAARLAFARDDWEACKQHLAHSAGTPWGQKASLTLLTEVYQRLGNREEAAEAIRRRASLPDDASWPDPIGAQVVELRVGKEEFRNRMGRLARAGRGEEALALLRQHLRDDPEDGLSWTLLGQLLLVETRDYRAADEAFQAAARTLPDLAAPHFYLGLVSMEQQDFAAAATCFRKAIALQPGLGVAHNHLGRCLLRQGDRAGALAAFRQALYYEPQVAEGHVALADLLAQTGKDDEALVHLRHALALQPGYPKAQQLLSSIEKRSKEHSGDRAPGPGATAGSP